MAGEGQMLRTAREEKSWSLIDAEEATKIRVRYIEALEEENYNVLPGSVYLKGFLRTYAKHLGLDPEEVIELYKNSAAPEKNPAIEPKLTPIRTRPFWLRPVVAVVMAVLAIAVVIGIANWSQTPEPTKSEYTPAPLPSAPKTPEKAVTTIPPSTTQPESKPPVTEGLIAKLEFTEDCWLNVQVDGKPALQGIYPAGTTKELKANENIKFITVGNAGGVSIYLNGTKIPELGKSRQVVHNIVLTKESIVAQ